jgi:hypothetical protein
LDFNTVTSHKSEGLHYTVVELGILQEILYLMTHPIKFPPIFTAASRQRPSPNVMILKCRVLIRQKSISVEITALIGYLMHV